MKNKKINAIELQRNSGLLGRTSTIFEQPDLKLVCLQGTFLKDISQINIKNYKW